jgi:hypothetical protein
MIMGRPQVSFQKWPFSAISVSIGGIACAAYSSTPPRNSTDFLELAENCTFLEKSQCWRITKIFIPMSSVDMTKGADFLLTAACPPSLSLRQGGRVSRWAKRNSVSVPLW